jgi:tRNA pseudouridine55 synthase
LDDTGDVVERFEMAGPSATAVAAAAATLTGRIEQVPPMVSAVRVGGRRLHELARAGVEVDREPRPVTVTRFATEPTGDPLVWRCEVDCSSGTYVRTLAADLGTALGGGAHLRGLRRTAIGPFEIAEARSVDEAALLPVATALRHLTPVAVDATTAERVRHGALLDDAAVGGAASGGPPPWAVLGPDGEVLAVYEPHRDGAKPIVVLAG